MKKLTTAKNIFIYAVFALYIMLLIKMLIISRMPIPGIDTSGGAERQINLIPFRSIIEFFSEGGRGAFFTNIIGNIGVFVPLGFYLPLFMKYKTFVPYALMVAAVSIVAEAVQGIFAIGSMDIDDVILNVMGGLVGIIGYKLLLRILGSKERVSVLAAIISALGLPMLLYYLFYMNMRF